MTCNAFKIIRQAGSRLELTEATLQELHSHIFAADREFQATYADIDKIVDTTLASQCDKILIRAYYYAKLDARTGHKPSSWKQFLNNFLSYDKMTGPTSSTSMKSLKDTLCNRFGMEFLDRATMMAQVAPKDLESLKDKIVEVRKGKKGHEELRAENDALHILYVRAKRRSENSVAGNPFGFKTWWLTQEVVSGAAAGLVFPRERSERYIMYPEFLINYIAFNPTTEAVRTSLKTIFPSLHGVRLGNRLDNKTYSKVIDHIREAQAIDEPRAVAIAAEASDALKTSRVREFLDKYEPARGR
jgi:hypothetical protein